MSTLTISHADPAVAATVTSGTTLRIAGIRWSRQTLVALSATIEKYGPTRMLYRAQDDPRYGDVETYADTLHRNNGKAVWLSPESVVIAAAEYHAQLAAERAQDVHVNVGDVVRVISGHACEAGLWRIEKPGRMDGDHARLVRVDVQA